MLIPDKCIVNLIRKHHVLTIATASQNRPYCANCFYIYLEKENLFAFTSDKDTRHISEIMTNRHVAGTVFLETNIIGKIQGLQFTGIISEPTTEMQKKIRLLYIKRFPAAVIMNTTFWVVEPLFIKMTDNKFGIGRKLLWEKGSDSVITDKHSV
jgi:uncharacterized protein YhbP (UPF0306 family)